MPDRKWIHRSRNRKPDSVNSAIEPSFERTAGQTLPSRVVFVVEVLFLLFVVLELVLVVELVVQVVLVVVVLVIIIEVLVVLVVLFLLGFSVVLRVHGILLVFD